MKILAIRGKNLASLYGEFELPLDAGPIADAGVFSISGPTGSGKSTLVDALCLPLYGETPRFDERGGGVKPGRPDQDPDALVDANDKRNLLSRGTGEGFAEVDFEGVDGKRYRARWIVHRARNKPDGRLQAVQMTLDDLETGTPLCAGVDEVKRRVLALVGYSFAEFRRAVVLPQFEFRAFLDAETDTRARILERVTGTEIYARLSMKAHERAGAEQDALDDLEARAAALAVLAPEERTGAEVQAKVLEATRERARIDRGAAEADVRWHEEDAKLAGEVKEADASVAHAEEAARAAGDRRGTLAEVDRAQPLRGPRDEEVRGAGEYRELAAKRQAAARALDDARRGRGEAEAAQGSAAVALDCCLVETEARRPDVDRARALDVRIVEAEPRAQRAEAALADARREVTAGQATLATVETQLASAGQARATAMAWIAARAAERALAGDWPRWDTRLRDHAELGRELARSEATLQGARRRLAVATTRRDGIAADVAEQSELFSQADAKFTAAKQATADDHLATLASQVKEAGSRRDRLVALRTMANEARMAAAARDVAAVDTIAAREALSRLGTEHQVAERQIAAAEASVTASREALARIEAALSIEERRAELVDGEPCPLCGAPEHPYAKHAPGESARKAQAAAVKVAEDALKRLQREAKVRAGQVATAEEKASNAAEAEGRHFAALADAEARYSAGRDSAGLGESPAKAEAAVELLARLADEAAAALALLEATQGAALARKTAADDARVAMDEARAALEALRTMRGPAEVDVERATGEVKGAEEKVGGLALRRDGVETELELALSFRAAWREEARARPELLAKACAAIAEDHAGRDAALREAGETLAALGPRREAVCASLSEKRARANEAEGGAVAERASLEALRSERSLLLGGKTVAEVERAQVAAQRASREALELAQKRFGAEDRRLAAAESVLSGVDSALEGAREKAEAAAAALGSDLATHGLDRARLDLLLGRGEAWMASERKALDALEAAVREELTKRAERRRKLEAHGAGGRPSFTLSEAKDRAAAADLAEKQAAQEHAAVQVRLLDDDRNRAARAALERDLTGQRAVTARWAALAALIGSHDGSALRVFAQGLALRALLQAANRHLENLAPRYRLEPVPRRDLDIQVVDGDLGNEVRGVNGLSGGESFLVSLALALGLATLSTRRTQARTLFIDEGFGTLDQDTLEQAMAAIDQLGSGERTVGVISHVPELHDRIGVKVTVERVSAGRSRIVLPEGMPVARERPVASPQRAS